MNLRDILYSKIISKTQQSILTNDEEADVIAAIKNAEKGNRGEVRLHLENRCPGDAVERARELFLHLGMDKTGDATGVLLYVAALDRKAAVYAGTGIHEAGGPDFWQSVIDTVAGGFSRGTPGKALIDAINTIGGLLRKTVPGEDSAGNELPDEITCS